MDYTAPKTAAAFLRSSAFVRILVGPVGSGKSSACVVEIPRRSLEQAPDTKGARRTRWAIVRNTYRELKDTTRKTFEQWIPPAGEWREQDFTFAMDLPLADGTRMQSEVMFRALDRPQDVKKLLSLELTGAYFNELREVAKPVFDGMQGRVGRYPAKADGGATWSGVWADSNPWHAGHWAHKLEKSKPEGFEFYHQPGGRSPGAENLENLPTGYYARLCHGKDSAWVKVYIDGEEAVSDVGSIFGALLEALTKRGGVSEFKHPADHVFTSWDLGIGDATAIWFFRLNSQGVADVLDFYAGRGKPLSHYFGVLDAKAKPAKQGGLGFQYVKHWVPHDARQRSLQTGVSVLDQFADRYGHELVSVGPEMSVASGLEAARWHLEQPMRFHARCDEPIKDASGAEEHPSGLEGLREYRFEWDEENKIFSRKPLHNWASNPSDAFRYLSCVVKMAAVYLPEVRPPSPAHGSPEWAAAEEEAMFEQAQEDVRQQEDETEWL